MIKRIFLVTGLIGLALILNFSKAQADLGVEPYYGQPLCLPDAYLQTSGECLALGPSQTLSDLARQNITLPVLPFPFTSPDFSLTNVAYSYAKVTAESIPVYATLDDAIARRAARHVAAQIMYLSYTNVVKDSSGSYYQFQTGEWASRESITPNQAYSRFQGVLLTSNPRIPFGWILDTVETQKAPGYGEEGTGHTLYRFERVWAYSAQKINDVEWVQVGVNEWVEKRYVARVLPNYTAPQGVDNQRWIEVNLEEQTLAVYDSGRMVFATMVSSGIEPFYTRPGLFQIAQKKTSETMTGTFESDRSDFYYLEDVPWTMYFDGDRALHGAYWHSWFGYPLSHGCVNLSTGDSHWLFDWANEGDYVYVWDPSGKTPTDISPTGGP